MRSRSSVNEAGLLPVAAASRTARTESKSSKKSFGPSSRPIVRQLTHATCDAYRKASGALFLWALLFLLAVILSKTKPTGTSNQFLSNQNKGSGGGDNYNGKGEGLYNLSKFADCDRLYPPGVLRPLWNESDWTVVRAIYLNQVGLKSFPVWEDLDYVSDEVGQGAQIDGAASVYHAAQTTDGKGRGIFASRNILKGELVESGFHYAYFRDGASFFKFMRSVAAEDKRLFCDLLKWTWIQDLGKDGASLPMVGLDETSLFNNAEGNEANVQCGPLDEKSNETSSKIEEATSEPMVEEPTSEPTYAPTAEGEVDACKTRYFATRDIEEGEELVGHYGEFLSWTSWRSLNVTFE